MSAAPFFGPPLPHRTENVLPLLLALQAIVAELIGNDPARERAIFDAAHARLARFNAPSDDKTLGVDAQATVAALRDGRGADQHVVG